MKNPINGFRETNIVLQMIYPTNTPRGFHIETWNPRGVFVGEESQIKVGFSASKKMCSICLIESPLKA